jgi:hypothetical protein
VRLFVVVGLFFAGIAMSAAILTAGPEPGRTAAALPAGGPTKAEPAERPERADIDAEVKARYAAYRAAQSAIETSDAAKRPQLVRPFLAEPARSRVLAGLAALDASGRRPYGTPVSKVFAVDVKGEEAVLHDCRDERAAGQLDASTGRRLTVGVANTHVVVRFARVGGQWLIVRFELADKPCR